MCDTPVSDSQPGTVQPFLRGTVADPDGDRPPPRRRSDATSELADARATLTVAIVAATAFEPHVSRLFCSALRLLETQLGTAAATLHAGG